jgi:hypothetical protein
MQIVEYVALSLFCGLPVMILFSLALAAVIEGCRLGLAANLTKTPRDTGRANG